MVCFTASNQRESLSGSNIIYERSIITKQYPQGLPLIVCLFDNLLGCCCCLRGIRSTFIQINLIALIVGVALIIVSPLLLPGLLRARLSPPWTGTLSRTGTLPRSWTGTLSRSYRMHWKDFCSKKSRRLYG